MKQIGAASVATGVLGTGTAAAQPVPDDEDIRGRIELVGHILPDDPPRGGYPWTYGHIREDGQYACVGSYTDYSAFLVDLSDLENPEEVHRVEAANEETRTNDVKFDGTRDGIYYLSQEADDLGEDDQIGETGIEVVDYGYADGTPEDPEIIAQLETPNTGVHKLTEHPEEPIIYPIDKDGEEPGVIIVDVEDPTNPEIVDLVGPDGYCHDVEVDLVRDVLYAAYIGGDFTGYVIFDISDPYAPEELSRVNYEDRPDYEEIGTAGFESCHQVHADPERDIAIVGDEVDTGVPGGKHFYDIGWDEGSLENPIHIGFTHSPNANAPVEEEDRLYWTTHYHDVIPKSHNDSGATLLVDGGYHEGTWVCDITDPCNPKPAESYPTDEVFQSTNFRSANHPPFNWSTKYNEERDFLFSVDTLSGFYTFRVNDDPFEFRTIEEQIAGDDGVIDGSDLRTGLHYLVDDHHVSVPNTGGEPMTREDYLALVEVADLDSDGLYDIDDNDDNDDSDG